MYGREVFRVSAVRKIRGQNRGRNFGNYAGRIDQNSWRHLHHEPSQVRHVAVDGNPKSFKLQKLIWAKSTLMWKIGYSARGELAKRYKTEEARVW